VLIRNIVRLKPSRGPGGRERLDLATCFDDSPAGPHTSRALIVDQFEEVLAADPTDHTAKVAFFQQLGQVLREHELWALFAMREEFIGALEPYVQTIPTRLANRIGRPIRPAGRAVTCLRSST
jgi:hypothetical protein